MYHQISSIERLPRRKKVILLSYRHGKIPPIRYLILVLFVPLNRINRNAAILGSNLLGSGDNSVRLSQYQNDLVFLKHPYDLT
jgi:hypothetical protein